LLFQLNIYLSSYLPKFSVIQFPFAVRLFIELNTISIKMGLSRNLLCLIFGLIPLFFFSGCGDLEPEMQDTGSVVLKMNFNQRSSSRNSHISQAEVSNHKTHLILALPSWENLSSNYRDYYSSFAQELMNPLDNKVSLEIPLNTQLKIFAFLFGEDYTKYQLLSGVREVGYYGESQPFTINAQTNNLSLGITLQSAGTSAGQNDGEDSTGGGNQGGTDSIEDTRAPTVSLIPDNITSLGFAVVKSTETGTAYLVNTDVIVNNLASITSVADNMTNSVTISNVNSNTNLSAAGLVNGTYKAYAVDAVGNLSSASINSVNVVTDYALNFDGINDYVSIPDDPFGNNNTFTIQVWVKPEAANDGAFHGFVGLQDGKRKPSLWVSTGGDLHYDSYKGTVRYSGIISDGNNRFFTEGEWVYVGWTNDGSNYKFYKNGNLVATETAPDTFHAPDSQGYQIGKVDNYFKGQIDEVAIWDVALSSTDITALYNSGNGLKASANSGNYDNSGDLVGYWKFNEGNGSTLTDNTSNSNNGSLTNMDPSSDWEMSGFNLVD